MLRKLNHLESIFDNPVEKAFINSRSVTLESKIDFYENIDLLSKKSDSFMEKSSSFVKS